jgi:hypothetical protein
MKNYEEEVLFRMYDEQIIGYRYKSIQSIFSIVRWNDLVKKYGVREKFPSVFRHLINKGYIDDHGKRGKAGSLSRLGVSYVVEKKHQK